MSTNVRISLQYRRILVIEEAVRKELASDKIKLSSSDSLYTEVRKAENCVQTPLRTKIAWCMLNVHAFFKTVGCKA